MTDTAAPALIMVQIRARSFEETMVRYGQSALATVADFGGELLAGTPEYRPLKDLRINELTEMNRVLLLEGAMPPAGT